MCEHRFPGKQNVLKGYPFLLALSPGLSTFTATVGATSTANPGYTEQMLTARAKCSVFSSPARAAALLPSFCGGSNCANIIPSITISIELSG